MLVTVIVPFLNERRYIRRCIEALRQQDFPRESYELVFVDNGATDGSAEVVARYPDVVLLREPRKNAYAARNRALAAARGEIIAFTDADCVADRSWLSALSDALQDPERKIVLGHVSLGSGSPLLRTAQEYMEAKIRYVTVHRYHQYLYGYTNNMAVRAEVFRCLGPLCEWPVPGDTEIVHRCMAVFSGGSVAYAPQMRVEHLEVVRSTTWLKKMFIYGKHNILVERMADYRPLNFWMRHQVYMYYVRSRGYSFSQRIRRATLLRTCGACYEAGRLLGRLWYGAKSYDAQ